MSLTGENNYFEDFTPGNLFRHARGKTMCEQDNVGITLQVLNTAEGHFNEDAMAKNAMGRNGWNQRLQFGGVTISMIVGLAMQDTGENAIRELKLDKIRLKSPVFHGDTLYAYSEVIDAQSAPERDDAGIVTFRHYGVNQNDQVVFEGERTVLIKKRNS
ncbi:MAG: MaoC family dehydratase [Pseudomonadales bacterium]|jgi:acyl dehydratase|nr:MaoC family dehydratase [Pseudomonadales bacterium]MDP6470559.1 MaoC family dehydratase [Pseudomonadales bacterium]MDP6827861.1 MaoC family dehydratase [Pseudomonadales bacterium]MDP6970550.1 MaoC family dehydratase [Pseudomonadales bacterium]|tara:strand:+ start:1202 stop:1678 length:477 start_codon:yes stop_codon:yes gene_type:complete